MPCYSFEGVIPVVAPGAYVHPTAVLIGDVVIGPGCYIGPNAVLRGDCGGVVVEGGSNIQDNCVVHSSPGEEMHIEANAHVGHSAVLHACRIGRNALVGISAVVMDRASIGESSLVGAMAFVPERMVVPPRWLATGLPARLVRELSEEEINWKREATGFYHRLAPRSLASLREVVPLSEVEAGRKAVHVPLISPRRTTPAAAESAGADERLPVF
jgi:phenylacetic acid degradation protein